MSKELLKECQEALEEASKLLVALETLCVEFSLYDGRPVAVWRSKYATLRFKLSAALEEPEPTEKERESLWGVLAVVTPESYPAHLRGVFLTRDPERANKRAQQINGRIFEAMDLDVLATRTPPPPGAEPSRNWQPRPQVERHRSGATSHIDASHMTEGDRIYDTLLKRYAIAGEFLPDGDVDVTWEDDGTYGLSKWHRCIWAEPSKADPKPPHRVNPDYESRVDGLDDHWIT